MALSLVIILMLAAVALAATGAYFIAIPLALLGGAALIGSQLAKRSAGAVTVKAAGPEPTGMPRSAPAAGTANERVEA